MTTSQSAGYDVEERVAEVLAQLDPAVNNGSLAVAAALTVYLSFRRDELHEDARELIRLAARAEWEGEPPELVVEWLDDRNLRSSRRGAARVPWWARAPGPARPARPPARRPHPPAGQASGHHDPLVRCATHSGVTLSGFAPSSRRWTVKL